MDFLPPVKRRYSKAIGVITPNDPTSARYSLKPLAQKLIESKCNSQKVVSADSVRMLRGQVMNVILTATPHVREVLEGSRVWSPAQVALFRTLAAKVLPDLEAKALSVEVRDKRLEELSREDLERLAAGLPTDSGEL